jgi:hypothetical protein
VKKVSKKKRRRGMEVDKNNLKKGMRKGNMRKV